MSARYLVTAENIAPRFFAGLERGVIPRIDIRGAYPVVRRAILAKHRPTLKAAQAEEAGNILGRLWPDWQHAYLAAVAEAAGVAPGKLRIPPKDRVRNRYDGNTPMVDLPRVRSVEGAYRFDQRNCAALCVEKKFSSKIWTRVGHPQDMEPCGLEELRELTDRYRHQAIRVGEWFYRNFFEATADAFHHTHRHREKAVLEVTTVGLRVDSEITDEEIDAWLFRDDAPNLRNEDLWEYLRCAGNIDMSLSELETTEHEWWAMPIGVRTVDGIIVSRRVLYLVRPAGDIVQIVGIALDDSVNGELANDVALKLSRFIASGI
ncbi:MAG: hypothetical protein ACXW4P_24160 [Thermoanaerobaculia bacterium]